ncbi:MULTISPECIES: CinA family protein [unclassified Thioalkalivibrio]|uniref:CinA family protein n=1 Tax=unclassified Thioalkalivibrio TaxID=2621013 RepID=UPI000364118B|nr:MULTISPECIES: CinA family protein [unclassified Thioalkalivibrio]
MTAESSTTLLTLREADAPSLSALVYDLGERLMAKGERLCTVESCTGGGIAQAMTDIPGSSQWFECGWVAYSNAAKTAMVGVPAELIEEHGAVSEAVARAMVEGGLARCDADHALSVTGIAGPGGGTPEKPVGTVCFGWQTRGGPARVQTCHFDGERHEVRLQSMLHALSDLLAHEAA